MNIDFVVMWLDGNDPEWIAEKAKYQSDLINDSNASYRFRDWDLMRYWFRAVEKFCPWVHSIYFVTYGHTPNWLDLNNPKLRYVKHTDFIPKEYLPTFNSIAIEMNLHRMEGLSEQFVLFNDDTYVLKPLTAEHFFKNELPCTYGAEIPVQFVGEPGIWQHLILNDLRTINNHFNKNKQVQKNKKKYISSEYYWKDNIRTMILEKLYPELFMGFKNLHAPAPFLKSTFEEIWDKEAVLLTQTSTHKFRTTEDVNQWLAIWWQIAKGNFCPSIVDNYVAGVTEENIYDLCHIIKEQTHNMVCINDPSDNIDFETLKKLLKNAFEVILPETSSFEKA